MTFISRNRKTKVITLRIEEELNKLIEKAVVMFGYRSKSDYIREAIIEYLAEFEREHEVTIPEEVEEKIKTIGTIIYV